MKNIKNLNEKSFRSLAHEREMTERMNRLFMQAPGEEDISQRSAKVKVFDLGAGRRQEVVYSEPVHFRENGEWKDIDNTLVEATDAQGRTFLENRANPVRFCFPSQTEGDSLISIISGEDTFSWRFEQDALPVKAVTRTGAEMKKERLADKAATLPKYVGLTRNSLLSRDLAAEMETEQQRRGDIVRLRAENTYEDVLPGVSVRYTISGQSVKEDIIIADANALSRTALRLPKDYEYEVTGDNMLLVKKADRVLFTMNTPFVYDADGRETIARVMLSDCGDYIRLEYVIEKDFMANAAYPITIDPLVNTHDAVHNIQDTTLTEGSSAKPYTASYLYVGKSSGNRNVALVKFNEIPIPKAKDAVVSAQLVMACTGASDTTNYVSVHEILKDWQSSAVNWYNANPYNPANVSDDAVDCVSVTRNNWATFNVTNLYRKWCTKNGGNAQNFGVALRSPANITSNNYTTLISSDGNASYRPVLYVNYVSHAGIEGWWHYETMGAGRAGVVHADLFNGNMVLTHADTVMTGNRNPVSVAHTYNSALSSANDYGCGYGWKTSANQLIKKVTWSDREYFAWEDGDGTQHYFQVTGSEPYTDEEGMELELTSTTNYMTITDKKGNRIRFRKLSASLARLYQSADAFDANISTYYYVNDDMSSGLIDRIVDPVGRVTKFTYSNGLLSSIRIPDTTANTYRYVYYTYGSGSRLTGIRYSDLGGNTAHTVYGYDGSTNILTSARNYDGIQVNIGYESGNLYNGAIATNTVDNQMRRVLSLETVAVENGSVIKYGAKETFEYKHMCTEVTAVENTSSDEGKKIYYQFNDSGNVVCVRDELGFGSFVKYDSSIENRPSESSKLRKAVINLLRTPDLSENWTGVSAVKDSSNRCLNAPSAKLTANSSEARYRQSVSLAPDTTYTFSAYVKTSNVAGDGAYLRLSNGTTTVQSEALTGTTAAAIGNGLPTDGWERIHVTLKNTASTAQTFNADMVLAATAGYAWFACPQLEVGPIANNFNIVSNGDFHLTYTSGSQTLPTDWTKDSNVLSTATTGVVTPDSSFPSALSGNALAIEGIPNKTHVGFKQTYDLVGSAGDIFTVGGWGNGRSTPNVWGNYRFCFAMRLQKMDGTWSNYIERDFNDEWVGWQFANYAAVANYDYKKIELSLAYCYNCNVSQFSNIFLYREAFGESFAYDDDKNLTGVTNLAGQQSNIEYDAAKNMIHYTQPGRDSSDDNNKYMTTYGSNYEERKLHLPRKSTTPMRVTDYYGYDEYGNPISSRRVDYRVYTGNVAETTYPNILTETVYDDDSNFVKKTRDARGNEVTRNVNPYDGTQTSVTDPEGQTVSYTYNASKRITGVQTTADGMTYQNAYTYENDRIKTVSHNTGSNTTNDVTYTFNYDDLGRKTSVQVGAQTLSNNVYENDRNGLLSEVQYGNGGKVSYTYDDFDRLTGVKYDTETTDRYTYEYGSNGAVAEVTDNNLGRVARTDYDLADRPCQTELKDTSGNVIYRTTLKYDKLNNFQQFAERVGSETHTSDFTYDRDNRVTQVVYDNSAHKVEYSFDRLGRISERTVESGDANGTLTSTYEYVPGRANVTNSTTPLVSKITQDGISFEYTYDNRGNIVSEKRGTLTTTYEYDAIGQLARVNDPHEDATWVYTYDRGGNILSKARYAYTTGALGSAIETIPYVYDNTWKDKLVSFNNQVISYDAIGNMTGDGTWTYTWQAGRQLKQMSKTGMTVQFKYDHNGLRTQKIVTEGNVTTTTDYILHGKQLMHMKRGNDEMHFFYDAQGRPAKVSFNGTMYTYVHNLQGDIVGILDSTGDLVVEYKYDAWGKPVSIISGTLTAALGEMNPFRYRGYVYDTETGLYYLRSRYYNALLNRFTALDSIVTASIGNAFSYVANMPVMMHDSDGMLPETTQVTLHINQKGNHWMISMFDIIVSFDSNGYTVYSQMNLEEYVIDHPCTDLIITDVPKNVALQGVTSLFSNFMKKSPDFSQIDSFYDYFDTHNLFGQTMNSASQQYKRKTYPCVAPIEEAFSKMGILLSATWGSPWSNDYYSADKTSDYVVAHEYLQLNGYSDDVYTMTYKSAVIKTLAYNLGRAAIIGSINYIR